MSDRTKSPWITANSVTIARLVLIPLPCYLLYQGKLGAWSALALGTILGLTDYLDGYLARKHGPTVLGALLDPIADKVFIVAAYTPFADLGVIPVWAVGLLLVREFLVTALRTTYERRGLRLETSPLAKMKTWFQMIGLVLLVELTVLESHRAALVALTAMTSVGIIATFVMAARRSRRTRVPTALAGWAAAVTAAVAWWGQSAAIDVTAFVVIVVTWWSGIEYLVSGWRDVRLHATKKGPLLHPGDVVRLTGAVVLPIPCLMLLDSTEAPAWAVIALLSLELSHSGLDNLLAHHGAHQRALPWSIRSYTIVAAVLAALAMPRLATAAVLFSLGVSLVGTTAAFWSKRAIYLADAAIDEKLHATRAPAADGTPS